MRQAGGVKYDNEILFFLSYFGLLNRLVYVMSNDELLHRGYLFI